MTQTIIELRNVTKKYYLGESVVHALRGVSLKIKRGSYSAILGPSGCGKSTLLHLMGLLDKPSSGQVILNSSIKVNDLSEKELARIRRTSIGFVFQQFFLNPMLTVLENVELPMMLAGVNERERVERAKELLSQVGLSRRAYHMPNQLSGGERQRVAIARALANKPSLILADEPTGNLDSKTGVEIMKMFEKLNEQGNTIVLVTHDLNLARRASKIIKMLDGRIIKK